MNVYIWMGKDTTYIAVAKNVDDARTFLVTENGCRIIDDIQHEPDKVIPSGMTATITLNTYRGVLV